MSTKKTTTNENPERHLIEAANILINGFETPTNLLEFLTRSFEWLENYDDERKKEGQATSKGNFFIRLLIEQLLHPWVKENRNNIPVITSGLKEIQSAFGYEGYVEYLSEILKGFAINMSDGPYVNGKTKKYMLSFSTMFEIGNSINQYEMEEPENITKAA